MCTWYDTRRLRRQLPVHLMRQLLQSTFNTLTPCLKQFGNLESEGLNHPKPLHRKGEVQGAVTGNISTPVASFRLCEPGGAGMLLSSVTGFHHGSRYRK